MKLKRLKKPILIIVLAALVIIAAIFMAIFMGKNLTEIELFTGGLVADLRIWRWFLISSTVIFWPKIIDYLAVIKNLAEEQIIYGKSLRWRILFYFVLIEFFIIEAIPARLLG